MKGLIHAVLNGSLPKTAKPILASYDSGEECSLNHWIEVRRLVDTAEDPDDPIEFPQELEALVDDASLEMEPAAAY